MTTPTGKPVDLSPRNRTLLWIGLATTASALVSVGGLAAGSPVVVHLGIVVLISVIIWLACNPFGDAAQWIGHHFRIPPSVRGATLDAVASSVPELFIGIFFVLSYDDFGATVATCAGSAVYNMMLIPAICALAISVVRKDAPEIRIEPQVLKRDGAWFLISELLLLYCLFTHTFRWWMACVFLLLYVGYVIHLTRDALAHQNATDSAENPPEDAPDSFNLFPGGMAIRPGVPAAIAVLLVCTLVIGAASRVLVYSCETMANELAVPAFFIAVIVAAAASSVPDTLISLAAAMRGDDSGAVSNAFGSNTFDVNVCLSVPVLLYTLVNPGEVIPWADDDRIGVLELAVVLWVFSAITLGLMRYGYRIGRGKALILCVLYALFVGLAIAGSVTEAGR